MPSPELRRVAIVASSYSPYLGGVESHCRSLAHVLNQHGLDVEVWTVSRDAAPSVERIDGVPVRRLACPLPARSLLASARFVRDAPRALLAWRKAMREFRPDVLHVNCYGPNGAYATVMSMMLKVPMVIGLHGETFADDGAIFESSHTMRFALRRSLRHARVVTGCSQYVVDDARRRFGLRPHRAQVLSNSVDSDPDGEAGGTGPAVESDYLLAVGRLVPNKGIDLLIDAFARAFGTASTPRLVIAGEGPSHDDLVELSRRLGVAERVSFIGRAEPEQVAALMRDCRFLVLPSRVEAFGLVILEAWRAGCAVVASTRGGTPEFVSAGEDGLLVDPLDVPALADTLRKLDSDDDLRAGIALAGRARVAEFSWDAALGRYLELYESALDRPTPG